MLHLGLCCLFLEENLRFRTTSFAALKKFSPPERRQRLSAICLANAITLERTFRRLPELGITVFRISSELFPLYTHPDAGYTLADLPDETRIREHFAACRQQAGQAGLRLSLHPDQFVVLVSPRPEVVASSVAELRYQLVLAELVGAEEINLHLGGSYGDKAAAIARFQEVFRSLPPGLQQRLTLENDDVSYTVADLLPVCRQLRLPLVYDVHHHRCLPDDLTIADASRLAAETWQGRQTAPHFHVSSPKNGWGSRIVRPHADYIDPADFPVCWQQVGELCVDVEAKAKEKAIARLRLDLAAGCRSAAT